MVGKIYRCKKKKLEQFRKKIVKRKIMIFDHFFTPLESIYNDNVK